MELEKYGDCNDLDQKKENTIQAMKRKERMTALSNNPVQLQQ